MREQHLNLLTVFSRLKVGGRLFEASNDIAGGFVNAARDLATRHIRTTLLFQWTVATVLNRAGFSGDRFV
jgi:hypothetical protein